jgi:Transposase IS66 family
MEIELPPISEAERTPLVVALLGIVDGLRQRVQAQDETIQKLRDEIAVLKGQKPKPKIAPSRLEAPSPKPPRAEGEKRPGSEKRSKKTAARKPIEVIVEYPDPPAGGVSNGYEAYDVQELVIEAKLTRYLRQRIVMPDGRTLLAPLPAEVIPGSHFGPFVTAYILYQYHQCHVTQPLLLEQLWELDVDISVGQLSNILTENKEEFHAEKEEVRQTGLEVSSYIGVDDTGARHDGKNGFCTVIGNDLFAIFESTDSKSRVNFLKVLRGAACQGYAINDIALDYWKKQKMPSEWLEKLSVGPLCFISDDAWQTYLSEIGLAERLVKIATEGALLGVLIELGVPADLVVLSDGAQQFELFLHASCWVHIERPLAKLVPYNETHRIAIEQVRQQIWDLYKDLKAYREKPDPAAKTSLEARFDELMGQQTVYTTSIGQVLKEMRAYRADLLRVLERPEVPLHNNGRESDIREYVKKRKISGSTRSDEGRRCRDTFASLKKTCRKLGVSFWAFLLDRIRGLGKMPRLSDLIRQKAAESSTPTPVNAVPA